MTEKTVGRYIYDFLSKDQKIGRYIDKLISPSDRAKKKAVVSSVVGAVVGKVVGLGWRSLVGDVITLKNHPISFMTIMPADNWQKLKIKYYFPTLYATRDDANRSDTFEQLWITAETKGIIKKEVVGVRFVYGCIGEEEIKNDKELHGKLLEVFKTRRMKSISSLTPVPITAEIEEKDGSFLGKIETCVSTGAGEEFVQVVKLLFECATRMSEHIQTTLETQRAPGAKEKREIEAQIRERPNNAKLHIALARALRPGSAFTNWSEKEKDDAIKAEAEYNRAIQLDPNSIHAHLELGMLYIALGWHLPKLEYYFTKAEKELNEAISLDHNLSEAHKALAIMYKLSEKYDKAQEHLTTAFRLNPDDKAVLYLRGTVLLYHIEKVKEAIETLKGIFPEFDPSLHRIERRETTNVHWGIFHRISNLYLALVDKKSGKSIRMEELHNFGWLD